ncbi:YaaA family protein [Subtercola boreus]|uniref:Peroxide stress protein YaaA n=1 Tax=Subtercola boreus TaxID=120213 RepID=A0A3E0WC32_9MICO|nr:peroxide stress protein YaaA [Subtercola boreus]RFA20271.1 hypothetical protein B7R24_09685 [Subtercola boreus]RFA20423.1 hypothetical protein B7R23_09620 [Subtercola boreus]RFA26675.1 hypothetical protein B7R25_09750 [Subtercola boreus]
MLILLPPSETKRDGGTDDRLDLSSLSFPTLKTRRAELVRAVRALGRDAAASAVALRVSPELAAVESSRNRRVTLSPTMPALDRYTGVVFDALDAVTLTPDARAFAFAHVAVHSALFGPVMAEDRIPAYRLSHDSRVPALAPPAPGLHGALAPVSSRGALDTTGAIPLKKHWAAGVSAALAAHPGLLLDFRSEGYVTLGPVNTRSNSSFLRVSTLGADGERRALNHFNKHAKGELTRALVEAGHDFETAEDLLAWAGPAGFDLRLSAPAELTLTV